MGDFSLQKSFYFLRHAETDHNRHTIYDDVTAIGINDHGVLQALAIKEKLDPLPLATVCSSPLLRVQQTLELALGDREYKHIVIEDLTECEGALWRLFLAWEERDLSEQEWAQIHPFIERVRRGVEQALSHEAPLLIVAHGGIYWALAHLLNLPGDRKINNCHLVYFLLQENDLWLAKSI